MENLVLEARSRDGKVSPKNLRKSAIIPAILYGDGISPQSLEMAYSTFRRVFIKAGENTIISLKIEGAKDFQVLVHDVQYHPISGTIDHVDFINVRMDKEVDTSLPVEIVGTSPAVRNLQAILSVVNDKISIRCLPKDLIQKIEVDISILAEFHDAIHVSDLKLPAGIKLMQAETDIVVTVVPPRKEEEVVPVEAVSTVPAALKEAQAAEAAAGGSTPDKDKKKE